MSEFSPVKVIKDDITKLNVDAIVNAANSALAGGGGVDGAIHRAAGPSVMMDCQEWIKNNGQCEPGNVALTDGGDLNVQYIIHAVGPIWKGGNNGEADQLRSAYRNSLSVAKANGVKSIAFSNISTGVYGFPKEMAAEIAITTVRDFLLENPGWFRAVIFCCYDPENFQLYKLLLPQLKA